MTQDDDGYLQQGDHSAQCQGAQNDGQQKQVQQRAMTLAENHNTPAMKTTIVHDSITRRTRVLPGKNTRARNRTMATAKAPSVRTPATGPATTRATTAAPMPPAPNRGSRWIGCCPLLSTSATPWLRSSPSIRRDLQFLNRTLHFDIALHKRRIRRRRRGRFGVARQFDVRVDAAVIDRNSGGCEIKRGRQFDGAIIGQRRNGLDRPLPKVVRPMSLARC